MHTAVDLNRFLSAQDQRINGYEAALSEIRRGRKTGHWIWYIFPQMGFLGHSGTAKRYGIDSAEDARAYLADPVLRARLTEISGALLVHRGKSISEIMGGHPDDWKLQSCMTLFREAAPELTVFQQVLDCFFGGTPCSRTLRELRRLTDKGE